MNQKIRQQRVQAALETLERNRLPWKDTPPLAALWIAVVATAAVDMAESEHKTAFLRSAVKTADADCAFRVPETPLRWLDLAAAQAAAMFTPELPYAHWQSNPGEPGYVNIWAIRKMMTHYAAEGAVSWPRPMRPAEREPAIAELCRSRGISSLYWSLEDGIVIAVGNDGPLSDRRGLQRQLSDILNDDVSVKTPGDMRPEQFEHYQARSRAIYRASAYAAAS